MKRTLAITAVTALLALSLAGCGDTADRTNDYGAASGGTTATDTMRDDNGVAGTGTMNGASTGTNGLGSVAGAANRGRNGANDYTATNNGGLHSTVDYSNDAAVRRAAIAGDNYARMLENGRVHDTDGFLLDGENTSWHTF
ncbi:MAG: hypothetical protein E7425_08730 [Ruminococcaceae bacterium]|nr:hypothetical protein [Oscillospiraceae bacterium]